MGFLEDGQVPQSRGAGPCRGAHPQELGQADQHGTHQERLVLVVADVLDLQDDVALQQRGQVEGWPPSKNRPVGPAQATQADAMKP